MVFLIRTADLSQALSGHQKSPAGLSYPVSCSPPEPIIYLSKLTRSLLWKVPFCSSFPLATGTQQELLLGNRDSPCNHHNKQPVADWFWCKLGLTVIPKGSLRIIVFCQGEMQSGILRGFSVSPSNYSSWDCLGEAMTVKIVQNHYQFIL